MVPPVDRWQVPLPRVSGNVDVNHWQILRGWGRVLMGYRPVLSIEITKECPLACPGCYAFHPDHLAGTPLTSLSDHRGPDLIQGVLRLVEEHRPLAVYLVGGEPLVRYRELSILIPEICRRNINVEVVTSAVRPIPQEWAQWKRLNLVISIDGLPPEHDERRKPATYDRVLRHIQGHQIFVHCTVTRQMMGRDTYLEEFVDFWSRRPEVRRIRISFYTPQVGEDSVEILSQEMREKAVARLDELRHRYPQLQVDSHLVKAYLHTPRNPQECLFAHITECVSADLQTPVLPCQLGGRPDCSRCGCLASVGLNAIGRYRLPGGIPAFSLFRVSERIGSVVAAVRRTI